MTRWIKRRPELDPMTERVIANRLTIAYVAGLTLIGVLACTIHILLDSVIVQQRDAGTIINVAGRQRMLSQRIAVAQVCSGVWQSAGVVPSMVQSWAMHGTCGLCGAWRACTMGEP